ncbi:MAG: hypothetical protein QOE70_2536 [Chthoniobacter sp.]|nr:hypothetical protein [Chthoniobacter sp.]
MPLSRKELTMSAATEEIIRVCAALPQERQREVIDFARFLLAQQGDERWEALLASKDPHPRLDAFLRESAAEGGEEPLDASRL